MTLEKFKELVSKIPDKHGKLEVKFYTVGDDFEYVKDPDCEHLTFHKCEHYDENFAAEEISLLFFRGYENHGD